MAEKTKGKANKDKNTKKEVITDNNIYYCITQLSEKCKNKKGILTEKDFYMASDINLFQNGRIHICKDCLKEYVYFNGEFNFDRFKKMLMRINYPLYSEVLESSINDKNETVGSYFKNIMLNHKGETWECGNGVDKNIITALGKVEDFQITKEISRRWGNGYTLEQYEFLEDVYFEWCSKYKSDTLSEQKTFQFLTLKELEIRRARELNTDTTKLEETYRKFMSDANVVPRDANAMNDADNLNTLGIWTMDIERYKPAEYFKDKKVYEDHDNIGSYYERFVLRPMKNLLAGTRDFDSEFNVENENSDDTIEFDNQYGVVDEGEDNGES